MCTEAHPSQAFEYSLYATCWWKGEFCFVAESWLGFERGPQGPEHVPQHCPYTRKRGLSSGPKDRVTFAAVKLWDGERTWCRQPHHPYNQARCLKTIVKNMTKKKKRVATTNSIQTLHKRFKRPLFIRTRQNLIHSVLLDPLCIWILFQNASSHSCFSVVGFCLFVF